MGVQLAEDMDISTSSAAQFRQIAAAVGPLAQHLARILAGQAAARPSRVSIRGTLRRATGTGGVPFSNRDGPAPAAAAGDRGALRHVRVGVGLLPVHP